MAESKGKSPFYPGQPVPPQLFTGRAPQLRRIKARAVDQVAAGKPVAVFIQGEFGIGKSSIANYTRAAAEKDSSLHGIYVTLGRAGSLEDVATSLLEGIVRSGEHIPDRSSIIRSWLGKYIKQVQLFGFTLNAEALKRDSPTLSTPHGLLALLSETIKRLAPLDVKGVILVLDEINGITGNPLFAHYIKDLVETNAAAPTPLPLLLMLCGVEARRNDLIRNHPPVGRIFDVLQIDPMSDAEARDFFRAAFASVKIAVEPRAMDMLVYYSGGLPKIMHEIGDAAYYLAPGDRLTEDIALESVIQAADEVGRKYVEPQVVDALRSRAYHSILAKLARLGKDEFTRDELAEGLTEEEAKKLDHFLRRLKKLSVLRAGESAGEYLFNVRMYQVYLTMKTTSAVTPPQGPRHG